MTIGVFVMKDVVSFNFNGENMGKNPIFFFRNIKFSQTFAAVIQGNQNPLGMKKGI